ncbi:hypothetical protein, partial [Salmonella enterica]|uniref:hypothetical protein n=1 Tax=Salmonella enterica TaxID=28901 RepID=UPI0006477BA5
DAPFAGGFAAMIGGAVIVGVSFQGTGVVGIGAGGSDNPGEEISRGGGSGVRGVCVGFVFWGFFFLG